MFTSQPGLGCALAGRRARARTMLKVVKSELPKHYYGPTFHGVDLAARLKAAEEKVATPTPSDS
jgi:hypothetical protein